MTFKLILPKIAGRTEEAGLVIMQAVLENRVENELPYKSSKIQHFRNLECQRVLRSLERLAEGKQDVPTVGFLTERYGADRLNKYREIQTIHFLYDGAKLFYQIVKGSDSERMSKTIEFVSEPVLATPLQRSARPDEGEEQTYYRWANETDRQEYVRVLQAVRRSLKKETGFIFDDN